MFKNILLTFLVIVPQFSYAIGHGEKKIDEITSPTPDRACLLFSLEGVLIADPSVNQGGEWFSVSIDHNGYGVITSMLLASKMANKNISVYTTGGLACNFPEVDRIKVH